MIDPAELAGAEGERHAGAVATERPGAEVLVARWRGLADVNLVSASAQAARGDQFGATISRARAAVQAEAAAILEAGDPGEAAVFMFRKVAAYRVSGLPLFGFDQVAVGYTKARTWQRCARTLDPTLPELQPCIR